MLINHLPSRVISFDNEEYLFFSGTSYLGMGHQPHFREVLLEGLNRYGTIFSASRNNNLQIDIYEKVENYIAEWTGVEAALSVTSGLMAGQLVVSTLANEDVFFINAPSTHPALWVNNAPKSKFKFRDYNDFTLKIPNIVPSITKKIAICSNTIDPLTCEKYNFDWLTQLPENQNITLVFDDSHGLGITNTEGGGFHRFLLEKYQRIFNQKNINIIIVASLAKAIGIPGGVILGNKNSITSIRRNPLFVGASPIIPAYLFAFLNSQEVYKEARQTLQKNIDYFIQRMENTPTIFDTFKILPHYPVFYAEQTDLYEKLFKEKIFISSFAYPNPDSPPVTRVILSALHTEGDIDKLVTVLKN